MYLYSKAEFLYIDQTLRFLRVKLHVEKLELKKEATELFESWRQCLLLRDFGCAICLIFQKDFVELIKYLWKKKKPTKTLKTK